MARQILVRLVALVSLVLVFAVAGCVRPEPAHVVPHDDRAYEVDSGELTLEEGLERSGIVVPECLEPDLRYALVNDGFNYYYRVYLGMHTTEVCMNEFLQENGLTRVVAGEIVLGGADTEKPLEGQRERWMDYDIISDLGWQVGSEQSFQKFSGNTGPNRYAVDLLVQHVDGSPTEVVGYLYAFHGG